MPIAELIAIGSELLLGQIVDTNSAWMAQRLTNLGVDLYYKTTVGDNPNRMKEAINRALDRSDVVLTGGGLGPTQDDLTRNVIAEATGRKLILDPNLLNQIEKRFKNRGFTMTSNNERQAYIPEGAIPVQNPNGTAPSFIVEDSRGTIFTLPGVPFELKWLFDNEVAPYLQQRFNLSNVITYKVLKIAGIGESAVDDRIGDLIANSKNPTVGVLAHPGQVDIRIAAKAKNLEEASKLIAPIESKVRKVLGRHIFAVDEESLEDAIGKILRKQNLTVAVYEDITSGQVSERLQQASSDHFLEGVVGNNSSLIRRLLTHSRKPKHIDGLFKNPETLADELAWAVRNLANSDLGVALHGVPNPEDVSENLAKGHTIISITNGKTFMNRTYNSAGRGNPDRTRMSLNVLELVRLFLSERTA